MADAKTALTSILSRAGITVGGDEPWDIAVHDERFYRRVLADGSLGLGEAYMEGWWDAARVDLAVEKLLRSGRRANELTLPLAVLALRSRFTNLQSRVRARQVIHSHYDLGNDLYESFLDPQMQYSCAYFKDTDDLDTAQEQKLDLICRKLHLVPGERLLDIGCGWGGLARFAAERYGVSVVGITLSQPQAVLARERCVGLPVEIRVQDYRDLRDDRFDKIVSVGMFEHVGHKNYGDYFAIVSSALKDGGIFLLHTIGQNETSATINPWVNRYIFPGGMLPSVQQIGAQCEGRFVVEDWHNFGPYYHQTLLAWEARFTERFPLLRERYPDPFYRMFRFYLLSFAGAFKARRIQLWQVVLSKNPADTAYESVR